MQVEAEAGSCPAGRSARRGARSATSAGDEEARRRRWRRPAQLLAHEGVGEPGQGGGEHEPEDEGVLRGREASTSSPSRARALEAGHGALEDLDPGLVVDADLEGVVLDAHDGAEDAGVDDHLVPGLQALDQLFELLLLAPHRQDEDEVEDAEDQPHEDEAAARGWARRSRRAGEGEQHAGSAIVERPCGVRAEAVARRLERPRLAGRREGRERLRPELLETAQTDTLPHPPHGVKVERAGCGR